MKNVFWIATALTASVLAGCGTPTPSPQNTNSSLGSAVGNATGNTASQTVTGNQAANAPQNTSSDSATPQTALKTQSVSLTVLPGARLGPDGKLHDTVTTPNFTVVEGVPVKLTVYNYDGGKHSITNSALGLNLEAAGSPKKGVPGVTTVTFTPTKTGDYTWQCMDACDGEAGGYAMSHVGYMEGVIHVVPVQNKQYIYMAIKDGLQYAAADGKLHDSYSPASFTVQVGIPVTVTVENFDSGMHSLTAPSLGVNQMMKAATKDGVPAVTTFTFTPTKAGDFDWKCIVPCDGAGGWAMSHTGYMAGDINVVS